jgi:CrcB protein
MADGLMVALGAVPGAWLRFRLVNHFHPMVPRKHWATLGVNVGACFLLGLVTALLHSCGNDQRLSLLICTGFLGSFSTFSTVMVELLQAWLSHQRRQTLALVLGSVLLGVGALVLGQRLGA